MSPRDETGFSLIELLIVVAILGIVVNIAAPVMIDARTKSQAAAVLADVDLIHTAVLQYRLERGSYPRTRGWGVVPNGLEDYLPGGFSFVNGSVRYRYQLQRRRKRIGVDGGRRNSQGREIVQQVAAMYQGRSTGNARRAFLWLPSPGGRVE